MYLPKMFELKSQADEDQEKNKQQLVFEHRDQDLDPSRLITKWEQSLYRKKRT